MKEIKKNSLLKKILIPIGVLGIINLLAFRLVTLSLFSLSKLFFNFPSPIIFGVFDLALNLSAVLLIFWLIGWFYKNIIKNAISETKHE